MKPHNVVNTMEALDSGEATLADTKHHCVDHDGEKYQFFFAKRVRNLSVETILMVQHCLDHQYLTLKDAAKEKLVAIEEEMKK